MITNFTSLVYFIKSDLYRYTTSCTFRSFLKTWFVAGFRYTFWMRICNYAKNNKCYLLFVFAWLMNRHYQYKYGIIIPYQTKIGRGLYIGHFNGIVINEKTIIGANCNISHSVTIGQKSGGIYSGVPVIGDRCYLAPGCKVLGKCTIGNDCIIGANAVVTKDIPDNSVAAGIPAKVISYEGSSNYVGSFYKL